MTTHRWDLWYRVLLAADAFSLSAAFVYSYYAVPFVGRLIFGAGEFQLAPLTTQLWLLIVIVPAWIVVLHLEGDTLYAVESSHAVTASGVIKTGLLSTALVALYLYATKNPLSRVFIATDALCGTAFLLGERIAFFEVIRYRRRKGWGARSVLILGSDEHTAWAIRQIRDDPRQRFVPWGYLSDSNAAAAELDGVPLKGAVSDYRSLIWKAPIDEVLINPSVGVRRDISGIVQYCETVGLTTRIIPDFRISDPRLWERIRVEPFLGRAALTIEPAAFPITHLFFKRAIDVVVSAFLLAVLSPLLGVVAAAVKLSSPGPIFYRWQVMGKGICPFTGFKFRTMVIDADQMKSQLAEFNEMSGPVFKMSNDPRVTPIGRVLRKYSLDELPQLWSVLVGDMSLVGPRPPGPSEFERFQIWQRRKLSVKPGITCLWQVMGRNRITDFDDWVTLDLEYIDNWSLWLDLKILAKTAATVIRGTGV